MKKIIALLLALPLSLALFGCGGSENNADADVAYESSLSILTAAWDALDEGARFAAFGGDFENAVADAPGVHSLDAVDSFATYGVPADLVAEIDDAASIMHAMNSNTISAIVFHLVDGADVDAAISAIQTEMANKQWMCGCPDKYIVGVLPGNYVAIVYGVYDVAGPFIDAMSAHLMGFEIVVDEPLA